MAGTDTERRVPTTPTGLRIKGERLWCEMHSLLDFNPAERVLLEEACRIADRLDKLDALLRGEVDEWTRVREPSQDGAALVLIIDSALSESRQQANQLKQLVAALRIPDEAAKRPQQRGGGRGAYTPSGATATTPAVASIRSRASS